MNQFPLPQQGPREPGPGFRVGLLDVARQYIENGNRYFEWQISPEDQMLAPLAGWDQLITEHIGESTERLVLPGDVRSASSALPGVEAFEGEKRTIIDFLSSYTSKVYEQFDGAIDTNLKLDTVAVGRGNSQIFMVPPHHLTREHGAAARWFDDLYTDLALILHETSDDQRSELLRAFRDGMPGQAQVG